MRQGLLVLAGRGAAVSRLYGGIHFRSDDEAGLELGHRIGAVAVEAHDLDG